MGLAGREELSLIVAAGLITIALNSISFAGLRPFMRRFFPELIQQAEQEDSDEDADGIRNRILIVGAGITGRELYKKFENTDFDTYIIEKQAERSMQQELGEHFIFADASHPLVLSKLNLEKTRWVLITTSEALIARSIADQVAKIDPKVKVLALSDKEGDRDFFISRSGQLDPNVSALVETRKEIADSIFECVEQDNQEQRKSSRNSKKKIKKIPE